MNMVDMQLHFISVAGLLPHSTHLKLSRFRIVYLNFQPIVLFEHSSFPVVVFLHMCDNYFFKTHHQVTICSLIPQMPLKH